MTPHEQLKLEAAVSRLMDEVKHLKSRVTRLEKWSVEDGEEPEAPFSSSITLTEDEKRLMSKKQIAFYEGKEEEDE